MLIISLVISFVLILFLYKKRVNLGIATMGGGLLLSLLAGLTPSEIIRIFYYALTDRGTVELVVVVFLILVMSKMMQDYGVLDKMVENMERIIRSPKVLLFIIPSLLSTFAAMGSAIVAANVIDSIGERSGLSKARRAAINLYMRHAWCFVLPLSVSLLNAAYIARIPIVELIKVQYPITLACLIVGYLVYLAPIKVPKNADKEKLNRDVALKTLLYASPLLLCVILVIWVPFYIALVASCILIYFIRLKDKNIFAIIKEQPKSYYILLTVAGIMVFKDVLQNIPGLLQLMTQMSQTGIPIWLVGVILAFGLGFVSGATHVFTAMLFPLLLPLVPAEDVVATAMVIYAAGFTSYYISPIHLCQALTNDYFGVSLTELYKEYYLTVPIMLITGLITYFIII